MRIKDGTTSTKACYKVRLRQLRLLLACDYMCSGLAYAACSSSMQPGSWSPSAAWLVWCRLNCSQDFPPRKECSSKPHPASKCAGSTARTIAEAHNRLTRPLLRYTHNMQKRRGMRTQRQNINTAHEYTYTRVNTPPTTQTK